MSPRRAIPQKKEGGLPGWVLPAIVGVVVVIGVVVLFTLQTPTAPSTSGGGLSASGRTAGEPKAKIAFAEYSDFQ